MQEANKPMITISLELCREMFLALAKTREFHGFVDEWTVMDGVTQYGFDEYNWENREGEFPLVESIDVRHLLSKLAKEVGSGNVERFLLHAHRDVLPPETGEAQ